MAKLLSDVRTSIEKFLCNKSNCELFSNEAHFQHLLAMDLSNAGFNVKLEYKVEYDYLRNFLLQAILIRGIQIYILTWLLSETANMWYLS